jgi:hypothetical protein
LCVKSIIAQISIVTIKEIVEDNRRLEIPMSLEVLKAAQRTTDEEQGNLNLD